MSFTSPHFNNKRGATTPKSSILHKRRLSQTQNAECAVCLESLDPRKPIGKLGCHSFHFECIVSWSQVVNTCPLCKARFSHITKSVAGRETSVAVAEKDQSADPHGEDEEVSISLLDWDSEALNSGSDYELDGFVVDDDTLVYASESEGRRSAPWREARGYDRVIDPDEMKNELADLLLDARRIGAIVDTNTDGNAGRNDSVLLRLRRLTARIRASPRREERQEEEEEEEETPEARPERGLRRRRSGHPPSSATPRPRRRRLIRGDAAIATAREPDSINTAHTPASILIDTPTPSRNAAIVTQEDEEEEMSAGKENTGASGVLARRVSSPHPMEHDSEEEETFQCGSPQQAPARLDLSVFEYREDTRKNEAGASSCAGGADQLDEWIRPSDRMRRPLQLRERLRQRQMAAEAEGGGSSRS